MRTQIQLVQLSLGKDNLKCAASAVVRFSLQPDFPDVVRLYRERTLERMAARRRWGVAVAFSEGDINLQVCSGSQV